MFQPRELAIELEDDGSSDVVMLEDFVKTSRILLGSQEGMPGVAPQASSIPSVRDS